MKGIRYHAGWVVAAVILGSSDIAGAARVTVQRLPTPEGSQSDQRSAPPASSPLPASSSASSAPAAAPRVRVVPRQRAGLSAPAGRASAVGRRRTAVVRQPGVAGRAGYSRRPYGASAQRFAGAERRVRVVRNPADPRLSRRYRHTYYGGHHWYGFYYGPRFHWARWHANRWWWFDNHYHHWAFWHAGYWWWLAPQGVTYVYINNRYEPYDPQIVAVDPPTAVPAPAETAAPPVVEEATDRTAKSPDGRRMLQTVGPNAETFLYDTSSGKPVFMKYLAQNVEEVRFTGGANGKPLQILLDFTTNDSFAIYDAEGNLVSGTAPTPAASSAPTVPPPPAPLPGE